MVGAAFSPDGSRIYLANVNGDIKVFGVDQDEKVSLLFSIALPPANASEAASTYLRQSAQKYYYQGQTPPQNIFSPIAWADFIQAWKRGDFRNNTTSTDQ